MDEAAKEEIDEPRNLEEKAISLIGRPLYEAFIRGYTLKQWEKDPLELAADIITRLPVRYNYNNRYFSDRYEGIPIQGYGKLFQRMLEHPLIKVALKTDFASYRENIRPDTIICFTGPIDSFFGYALGRLEWRTVDFAAERHPCQDFQGTSVMNFAAEDVPYTRIHKFKHYHPEREDTGATLIFREYSRFAGKDDEPYYPVDTEPNRLLFAKYQAYALENAPNVIFGGRLGMYQYLDMDDAIAAALDCYTKQVLPRLRQ